MKVLNFIKNNIKGVIIGVALSATTVFAATIISANEISFDNTALNTDATTVQDALDELDILSKNVGGCPDGYICTLKAYYAYGSSISESDTTNYTKLGKNVFLKLDNAGYKYVCILRSEASEPFCIMGGSSASDGYMDKYDSMKENFGSDNCYDDYSDNGDCRDDDFRCYIDSYGTVDCRELSTGSECAIRSYDSEDTFSCY